MRWARSVVPEFPAPTAMGLTPGGSGEYRRVMSTNDLDPTMHCSRCGAELESESRFCSNCGQAVNAAPAKPEPSYWSDSSPDLRAPAPPSAMPAYVGPADSSGGIGKLFSAAGRIGRLEYFLTIVGIWGAIIVLWTISAFFDAPVLLSLLLLVVWLLATIVSVIAGIKRLHDFDQSGWLILLNLVPFVGFILFFVLLLKGSSPGLNQYGYADSGSVMG